MNLFKTNPFLLNINKLYMKFAIKSKFIWQFAIFFTITSKIVYYLSNLTKGYDMSIIIENAQSLFQRFENSVEEWADKLF